MTQTKFWTRGIVAGLLLAALAPAMGTHAAPTASSSDVWAVGSYTDPHEPHNELTLVEHWNGTAWEQVPSPNGDSGNGLEGIAAVSATDIWAVGTVNSGRGSLIDHWDGTSWKTVPSPKVSGSLNSTGLHDVAAIAANDVWAVGNNDGYLGTVVEHWDGARWPVVPSPDAGTLSGVAAIAADDIWAGGTQTLHWDGTGWSLVADPNLGSLSAVAVVPGP